MDDHQIIELYNLRQERAITETDTKYGNKCRWFSNNIVNSFPDAEECTNDAYLVLWQKIPPEVPESLLAFLLRIVRNLSLKRYEHNRAKKRNSSYDEALEELEAVIGDKNTPEEEILAQELGKELNHFLHSLTKEQRQIFMKRYWYGCPVKAIAADMGITPHNVTVRLGRIRQELKEYLGKRGYSI